MVISEGYEAGIREGECWVVGVVVGLVCWGWWVMEDRLSRMDRNLKRTKAKDGEDSLATAARWGPLWQLYSPSEHDG